MNFEALRAENAINLLALPNNDRHRVTRSNQQILAALTALSLVPTVAEFHQP